MAIKGEKPNGYFVTYTGDGVRVEGESRQCAHCQFTWEYKPHSGRKYGLCLSCNGIICGREECKQDQLDKMSYVGLYHPELAHINCIRASDWDALLTEDQLKIRGAKQIGGTSAITFKDADIEGLAASPGGIIIPK